MAKRKRLSPITDPVALETKALTPGMAPPIAQVAGASAAFSAAQDIEDRLRGEGRLIITLSLEAIDETHLMRDRMGVDPQDMEALIASLKKHGQRNPIEVEDLGQGRFGLISGWRRLTALKTLYAQTGEDRFGRVTALLRTPNDRADAYISMVEENEIRAGLSYYERARVAARAAGQGAFTTPEAAVDTLFAAGSRARRSKIRSFLRIYAALDDVLNFPRALPERLGLRIAEALKDGEGEALRAELTANPAETAQGEAAQLQSFFLGKTKARSQSAKKSITILDHSNLKVTLKKAAKGFSLSFDGTAADKGLERKIAEILRLNLGKD